MLHSQTIINFLQNPLILLSYLIPSFILGLVIAYVYKSTNRTVSYSQSFVVTLVLLLPVISLIIAFIANNIAAAIGVFGAFSVIRFRNAIKDSKDMFFIFWVLATGLIIGVNQIISSIFTTSIISLMVYILHWSNFGRFSDYDYLLVYFLDTTKADVSDISSELKQLISRQNILNIQSSKDGKETEITTSITLKKDAEIDDVLKKLKKNKAIKSLSLNPAKFDLEY